MKERQNSQSLNSKKQGVFTSTVNTVQTCLKNVGQQMAQAVRERLPPSGEKREGVWMNECDAV
jgi:hypothetical protein